MSTCPTCGQPTLDTTDTDAAPENTPDPTPQRRAGSAGVTAGERLYDRIHGTE